jgi:hypothetical protein
LSAREFDRALAARQPPAAVDSELRLPGNVRKVFRMASFSCEELVEEIRAAIEPGRAGGVESRAS